jgi:hypothetical protein
VEAAFTGLDFPRIRRLRAASICEMACNNPVVGGFSGAIGLSAGKLSGTPVHPLQAALAFNIPVRCPARNIEGELD